MPNNITVEDIKELLNQFGITTIETINGKIIFIDKNNEMMDARTTGNPLLLVPRDDVERLTSPEELISTRQFAYLKSPNQFLKYKLKEKDEKHAILSELNYQHRRPDGFIEDSLARFEKHPSTNGVMNINTIVYSSEAPTMIIDRKNITVFGNGIIQFDLKNCDGFIEKGKVEEGWSLEESEMSEELNNNELLTILAKFNKRDFPKVFESIQLAKENLTGYNK